MEAPTENVQKIAESFVRSALASINTIKLNIAPPSPPRPRVSQKVSMDFGGITVFGYNAEQ